MITSYAVVTGTGSVTNAGADATIIAAQGAGKRLFLVAGWVNVYTAAVGGGGAVALEDGLNGTQIFRTSADAVGYYPINLNEEGYPLTANTLLNLTTENAVTTQASARATLICKVV